MVLLGVGFPPIWPPPYTGNGVRLTMKFVEWRILIAHNVVCLNDRCRSSAVPCNKTVVVPDEGAFVCDSVLPLKWPLDTIVETVVTDLCEYVKENLAA